MILIKQQSYGRGGLNETTLIFQTEVEESHLALCQIKNEKLYVTSVHWSGPNQDRIRSIKMKLPQILNKMALDMTGEHPFELNSSW